MNFAVFYPDFGMAFLLGLGINSKRKCWTENFKNFSVNTTETKLILSRIKLL